MLAWMILVVGILSRVMFHEPNFTPVIALVLFGGMYLRKEQAVWVPVVLMIVSDVLIGFHSVIAFTWGSMLAISLLGALKREDRSFGRSLVLSFVSAVLFFVVTNFGAWLAMYPKTLTGLMECYIAAIPFFRTTLFSTLMYSCILWAAYELGAKRFPRLATV
jgi:hypothetical protein